MTYRQAELPRLDDTHRECDRTRCASTTDSADKLIADLAGAFWFIKIDTER
jgi:hypothetical protein